MTVNNYDNFNEIIVLSRRIFQRFNKAVKLNSNKFITGTATTAAASRAGTASRTGSQAVNRIRTNFRTARKVSAAYNDNDEDKKTTIDLPDTADTINVDAINKN